MIPEDFKDYFTNCSKTVQGQIVNTLLSLSDASTSKSDFQEKLPTICPHCSAKEVIANGRLSGVQRFRCKNCGKNFSETTGKVWYNLKKKDKISKYVYCLLSGYSIRKSAKEVGISVPTSFTWRHKFLSSFKMVSPDHFSGIVESDDLFFLHSEKGSKKLSRLPRKRGSSAFKRGVSEEQVAVIASCDRSGNKDFKVATRGRISKKDIARVLKGKVEKAEVLCTDSHRSYTAFAKSLKLEHKKFNASKGQRVVEKIYHVQNVNSMDARLRIFMDGFNGVATKYLQNYLNWFLVLEKVKHSTQKMSTVLALSLSCSGAWFEWKQGLYNMLI